MPNITFGPGTGFGTGITFQIPTTTYTLTPASGSINEGTGLTFTVGGTYIPNGTYYWTVNNVTTSGGDFSFTVQYPCKLITFSLLNSNVPIFTHKVQ